jgi:excisionase family DNA binding protein
VPNAAPDEALWTVAEVAAFLKVSRSFVYQACAAKTVPHVRIGASLRFDPATLRAWVRGERADARVGVLPGCR